MNYEKETREINLKYILLYVLRQWRTMLCVGLVLAFLFGAYKGVSGFKNLSNDKKNYEELNKVYTESYKKELALYNTQKKYYKSLIDDYRQDIEDQEEYLKESILMNLDYKKKALASMTIFFKLDEAIWDEYGGVAYDPTDSLISLFYNKIYYNIDWEAIAKKYDIESKYIEELVRYENQMDSNIIKISVSHSDKKSAEEILDQLIKEISDQAKSFQTTTFNHTINIVKNETKYIKDTALYTYQKEAEQFIITTSEAITSTEALEKALIKPVLTIESPYYYYVSLIKNTVIFAIIGAIFGVFVVIIIYALAYCFSNKVHSEEEFVDLDHTKLLGKIDIFGKRRFGHRLDAFIEKFSTVNSGMTKEQKGKLLAYNINDVIKSAKSVLLIGSVSQEVLSNVSTLISKVVENANITVEKDIIKNSDAYGKITENDVIIAVEKIGGSNYTDIANTEQLIKSKGKAIAGYILA